MTKFSTDQTTGWVMVFPTLAVVGIFSLYPAVDSFLLSLHQIYLGLPSLGEPFIGLDNYVQLFQDPVAHQAFLVTLGFVVLSTTFELVLGLGIALVIHEHFSGRGWVRAAVLIPWAIPTVVASQMWRFLLNDQYGLANLLLFGERVESYVPWLADPWMAFGAIVLADVWKTSSFAGLLILAGLQIIPDDVYDAARIDGATAWQRFWHITLPLLKPALLTALLFRTIDAFRVFDLVFVMTQGGPGDATQVIQFYGYKTLFTEGRVGYGTTISVTVFVAILILSLFYVRTVGSKLLEQERA
ncbi:sugar ABC transporter permease [Candidatus Nitronereus thalassa]|uniref:Sugar ABC transporter permease n=1 Tax=Candidatus Nitronereus thalassa TaxID=3020898 RepID=A0ABU3K3Q9_9BACT|nr:sugar ABC transporter permease [Candidatus Nitronereus thalassa]MDT7041027.1 sugar ABC transporter permease [Candidatus Nitronereus thalassa]